jgi:CelD/BcsL family acetyltransferase involved in cellulose biosynthesis
LKRALWVVLCLSMMAACEQSKTEILQRRLDDFRNMLPEQMREEFDSGDYAAVARGIDSLVQADSVFREKYDKLKHEELIDVFSAEEVVDFYREHFLEEIERLKQEKKRDW